MNDMIRKKSILKGSPNFLELNRFDADGHPISPNDRKHKISFKPELYQIKEVERLKDGGEDNAFLKKCCKYCSIQ